MMEVYVYVVIIVLIVKYANILITVCYQSLFTPEYMSIIGMSECSKTYLWIDKVFVWWVGYNDGTRCTCGMEKYHNDYHTECRMHWNGM